MINSKVKGASGEREFARLVHDHLGVVLERNLNQSRSGDRDLVVVSDCEVSKIMTQFAIEVKRYKESTEGKLSHWWNQAVDQAQAANLIPLLAFRGNRQPWRIVLPLSVISSNQPIRYESTAWLDMQSFGKWIKDRG